MGPLDGPFKPRRKPQKPEDKDNQNQSAEEEKREPRGRRVEA